MRNPPTLSCGQALARLLEAYGIDTVFGIPGVHTVELYRELPNTSIRHITPRHEQGAGFMADGYARTSGRPGVCFLITGPGITNAATALAQAYSDSVPVLAISSVNRTGTLGRNLGCLHELPSQQNLTAQFTAFSHTVLTPEELPAVIAEAFAVFGSRRPQPVHIEIPIDVLTQPARITTAAASTPSRPAPDPGVIREMTDLLKGAVAPVVILGGGTRDVGPVAGQIVERLGAPALLTVAAKGVIDESHPLCVGASLQFAPVQSLIETADVVLAVGTEFSETDWWREDEPLQFGGTVLRIDIDPQQLTRNALPAVSVVADAALALNALNNELDSHVSTITATSTARVAQLRDTIRAHWRPGTAKHALVWDIIGRHLPDNAIITADSTQLVYSGNHCFGARRPRSWHCSTTGYGTLGYALPAAIGAQLASPKNPVLAVMGDGGLMFTVAELASAVQLDLPIAVLVWHNDGYAEIRDYMRDHQIAPQGVDLTVPDLQRLADAFGCAACRPDSAEALGTALQQAFTRHGPSIIELREDAAFLGG